MSKCRVECRHYRYSEQVKLVRVAGREGEQVYIQIGDDEMEMLTQQQAEQVSTTISRS